MERSEVWGILCSLCVFFFDSWGGGGGVVLKGQD